MAGHGVIPVAVHHITFPHRHQLTDSIKKGCGREVGFSYRVILVGTFRLLRCIDVLHTHLRAVRMAASVEAPSNKHAHPRLCWTGARHHD